MTDVSSVFKVGETYDTVGGRFRGKVVAIEQGRLVIVYNRKDGDYFGTSSRELENGLPQKVNNFDLVPPKEQYVRLSELKAALAHPGTPYGGYIYARPVPGRPGNTASRHNIEDLPKYEF